MKSAISLFPYGIAAFASAACALPEPSLDVVSEQRALTDDVQLPGYRPNTGNPLDWWIDTGIPVTAGSAVGASCVAGRNLPWGGGKELDCAGDTDYGPWTEAIAPACVFGSLVAKIGSSTTHFCLGASPSFTANTSGTLHLGFNDGSSFTDNQGQWDIQVDVTNPAASGWSVSAHPAGPSWVWNQDPALRVVLADDSAPDPWGRGVYFIYGSKVHAVQTSNYYVIADSSCGSRWAPQILVAPRGSDPLISASDDLVLAVLGSDQHGCDGLGYHEATVTITAQPAGGGIDITAVLDGVGYFAFPPTGTVEVQHTGGPSSHAAADLVADGTASVENYDGLGVTQVVSSGSALGTITLDISAALPKFHLQGGAVCPGGSPPSGFIELDGDHSCEVSGFPRPTFTLSTHITP
jgi:hypothetical protein